ncbi:MAG TPA: hypothetical protein VGC04_13795 [Cellulomonas sp.]
MTSPGAGRRTRRLERALGFASSACLLVLFITSTATQAWTRFDPGSAAAPSQSGGRPAVGAGVLLGGHGAPGTTFGWPWSILGWPGHHSTPGWPTGGPSGGGGQGSTGTGTGSGHLLSGPVTLTIRQGSTAYLRFDDLMPGDAQTRTIAYSVSSNASTVDLWIVFDPGSAGYQAFTGAPGSADSPRHPAGGLGSYAYFAVSDSNGGPAFDSGNLEFVPGTHNTGVSCTIDPTTGRGGGGDLHKGIPAARWFPGYGAVWGNGQNPVLGLPPRLPWTYPVSTPPSEREMCGVPGAIRLAANLRTGTTGTVSITLGLDPTFTEQGVALPVVPFTLVAMERGAPYPCPAPRLVPSARVTSRW